MKNIAALLSFLLSGVFPAVVFAQGGDKDSVQGYLVLITNFIGDTLLPFLFAIALLFFLVNVARYFILGGSDSESQEKAKTLAIYGVGAFVFLVSLWGIVNMFVNAFEIDDDEAKCPDYLQDWCGSSGNYGSSGGGYQRFDSYYGDFSNDTESVTTETFEDGSQIQTTQVRDRYGNVIGETEIDVMPLDEASASEQNIYGVPEGEVKNIYRVDEGETQNIRRVDEGYTAEPVEEAEVHQEESAPVNISDTNTTKCFIFNGIEVCD
jgi:hypothetical protein